MANSTPLASRAPQHVDTKVAARNAALNVAGGVKVRMLQSHAASLTAQQIMIAIGMRVTEMISMSV